MKNQDKATANYAKRFTKKKGKSFTSNPEDSKDSETSSVPRCKFCEKEHALNKCWHLQAECYYCYKTGHIAKFCKKKLTTQTSSMKSSPEY